MSEGESTDANFEEAEFAKFREKLIVRLDESRRQLDEGDYVEFDEQGLRTFFDGLIERAQKRNESK